MIDLSRVHWRRQASRYYTRASTAPSCSWIIGKGIYVYFCPPHSSIVNATIKGRQRKWFNVIAMGLNTHVNTKWKLPSLTQRQTQISSICRTMINPRNVWNTKLLFIIPWVIRITWPFSSYHKACVVFDGIWVFPGCLQSRERMKIKVNLISGCSGTKTCCHRNYCLLDYYVLSLSSVGPFYALWWRMKMETENIRIPFIRRKKKRRNLRLEKYCLVDSMKSCRWMGRLRVRT